MTAGPESRLVPGSQKARSGPVSGAPWTWVLQMMIFLLGGPPLAFPSLQFDFFLGKSPPVGESVRLAHDAFALLGVHATAIGILTVYAFISGSHEARRRYSRIFLVFTGSWTFVLLSNLLAEPQLYTWRTWSLLLASGTLAIGNFLGSIQRLPDDSRIISFGDAASAPAWTWPMWLVQGTIAFGGGIAILTVPQPLLEAFVKDDALVTPLAIAQFRFSGAYLLGYACLSYSAMGMTREDVWRPVAGMLALWPIAAMLLGFFRLDVESYTLVGYAAFVALGALGIGNLRALRSPALPWADDVSLPLGGWTPHDLMAGPMMGWQTLRSKKRASHLYGVGARGKIVVPPANGRPSNAFFAEGRSFPCVVRFANLSEEDDAGLDVRGFAISMNDGASRFDMVLNTGSTAPVRSVLDFSLFVASKFLPEAGSRAVVKKDRGKREGAIVGLRRAPSSFTQLYFHSQIVRWWFDDAGDMWLVRYRVAPNDLGEESGYPDLEDCSHVWVRTRREGDSRPRNYLRQEVHGRLGGGPVRMRLQAQFDRATPESEIDNYDASVDWPEATHPWYDIGTVELTEPVDDNLTERLVFNPGHHPPSLGIPPSSSLTDPRSLADSEVRVMAVTQRIRAWAGGYK